MDIQISNYKKIGGYALAGLTTGLAVGYFGKFSKKNKIWLTVGLAVAGGIVGYLAKDSDDAVVAKQMEPVMDGAEFVTTVDKANSANNHLSNKAEMDLSN